MDVREVAIIVAGKEEQVTVTEARIVVLLVAAGTVTGAAKIVSVAPGAAANVY